MNAGLSRRSQGGPDVRRPGTSPGSGLASPQRIRLLVSLIACGAPVRRALRIEPTEVLRDVG